MTSDPKTLVGQSLGRYQIDARLGAGGMGVVYRAHDRLLQRDVAIKLLGDDVVEGDRLLQEARNISALNHPNICTVYEVGEHEGHPFIVMEFIEGEPLSVRVERGALPASELLKIGEQIADALVHAHGRGVIHRDLKCANVVAMPDGRVKVLDFGIALRPSSASAETVTGIQQDDSGVTGAISGTVAYMAPEVLRGEPADQQSEIWSVGVLLYELAAGRRPFKGGSTFALVAAIVGQDPKPLPPAIPAPVAALIGRCLARERSDRYQTARELKTVIETVRMALTTGRHMVLDVGAAAQRRIESIAVLPLANRCAEPGQEFFVDGMTDAIIAELSRLQALRVISLTSVMRYRDTVKAAPEIAAELGVDALIEGSVMVVKGTVRVQAQLIEAASDRHVWSRTYDRPAEDVLALHTDVARAIVDDIRVQLSPEERAHLDAPRRVNAAAHELWLKGRYLQNKTVWTPADYEQALSYYEQSAAADPGYAPAYVGQADICHRLGGYGFWPPKKAFGQAKTAAERAVALDAGLANAHAAVGFSRWLGDWNYAESEREYLRAIELGSHEAIHQYASLLSLLRRHDEAVARYQQAASVNPFSSDVHWGLGMIYRQGGWPDRGVEALKAWLLIEPNDVQAMFQLALTLVELPKHDEAIAILQGMAAVPQLKGLALGPLAYALGRSGQRGEAQKAIDELQPMAAAGYPVQGWLAMGHMGLGDHEKAVDALTAAVDMHDSWMPSYMHVEPAFAPLHGHPRFQALLEITGHEAT